MLVRFFLIMVLIILTNTLFTQAQNITNFIMVGPHGVTEDPQKATSFIVVKERPGNHFERLDYLKAAPLQKLRTYKDTAMTILDGRYFEYAANGSLLYSGMFKENKKEGEWRTYNDTGKVISLLMYSNDSMIENVDLTLKKGTGSIAKDDKEAIYPGGDHAWSEYVLRELQKDNPANQSFNGGRVLINFIIDIDGAVVESFISKSAEFMLDEKALLIVEGSKKWIPAVKDGKKVKAYRKQPFTFIQQEE